MKRRLSLLPLLLAGLSIAAQPEGFRFERTVTPGGKGPNRLEVDVALLSGATPLIVSRPGREGLEDLRLFDAAGHEVPYLEVWPPPEGPAWRRGTLLPVLATKVTSGFEVDLGAAPLVERLRVLGLPGPFLKRCRLEGSGDRSHYTLLVAEGTLFDLPDERLEERELPFAPGEYRYLRVTWDDRSSGRVPVPRAAEARLASTPQETAQPLAAVTFERRESEPGKSRMHLRLPGPHLPVVALHVAVSSGHVFREARVSEPRLVEGEVKPVALGGSTLKRAERDGLVAADLRIPVSFPEGAELDLVVEDGDNPPLAIATIGAELIRLPYVYFESPGGEAITARFGNPGLKAPRYDLEAMRDYLARAHPAAARWGERRDLVPAGPTSGSAAPLAAAGAPLDTSRFRFVRRITGTAAGLNAVLLDAAILAHSPPLQDLRIADAEGRQVPYLLERREEPLTLDLGVPVKAASKEEKPRPGLSLYALRLPFETLPAGRLVLATGARLFERHVTVKRVPKEDERRDARPETVASATWRHAAPELPPPALVLDVPAPGTASLLVEVDEGDNSPLPLLPAKLLLPSYRLRFFREDGAEVSLLYGAPDLAPPRYDLALYAPRLVGVSAREVTLAPEAAGGAAGTGATAGEKVFWLVLAGAVVALLVLLFRLLRKTGT